MFLSPHEFPPASRQQYLDAEFPPGRLPRPRSTISGMRVFSDGNVATASYEVVEPYPLGDAQQFEIKSRRLDAYARIAGQWRLLVMAVAEPPTWPPEVTLPPALLTSYAGVYQLTSTQAVTVTVENGRLMAEVTGQARVPLFAENDSTFFDRTDSPLARTVFERDGRGRVVAQVYRALGQELRASKVR